MQQRLARFGVAIVGVLFLSGCVATSQAPPPDPARDSAILAVLDRYMDGLNALDIETHVSAYHFPHYRHASRQITVWASAEEAMPILRVPRAERREILARRDAKQLLALVYRKCLAGVDGLAAWREGFFPWERVVGQPSVGDPWPFRFLGQPWQTLASTPQRPSVHRLGRIPTAARWRDRPWWERVPLVRPPLSPRRGEGSPHLRPLW